LPVSNPEKRTRSEVTVEKLVKSVNVSSAGAQQVRASLSYYSLIRQTIISLKDRGGSSRQAINKVVKASKEASGGIFKSGVFNKALSTAIQNGALTQKKSSNGAYKLSSDGLFCFESFFIWQGARETCVCFY
jgi:hypothetical protein